MFKPGDRVATKSGKKGTVKTPLYPMPNHYFILFDDGQSWWMTKDSVTTIEKAK